MMYKDIIFSAQAWVPENYYPKPAIKDMPEWYKNTPEYTRPDRIVRNGATPHTIKKCMPVFDAMTAGYIIYSHGDVQVSKINNDTVYEWSPSSPIEFHSKDQAPIHPMTNSNALPKWINPWAIKTPKGYSCLFISPMHRSSDIFTILPGIVDTDQYYAPVNFPFSLNNPDWTGIIKAGTPIVQVIPFKRELWKNKINDFDENNKDVSKIMTKLRSKFFNSYKTQFWSRKEFK